MKSKAFFKSSLVLMFLFIGSMTIGAVSPKTYLYDTKEENGKVISKVVFAQENGLLNREVRYEFSYNDEGKVSEKKAFRWDKNTNDWAPYYLMTYRYSDDTIHSEYKVWDKKTNGFSLNPQSMMMSVNDYDNIFS